MNELAITTESKLYSLEQLRIRNREKYPAAYFQMKDGTDSLFNLGSYLINYCLSDSQEADMPSWAESHVDFSSTLTPMRVDNRGVIGFFGMPEKVQEGVLICIQEEFYHPDARGSDFYEYSNDFLYSAYDIVHLFAKRRVDLMDLENPEKKELEIEGIVEQWEEWYHHNLSYYTQLVPFFSTEEEVMLFCQLAAYMGFSVQLYPDDPGEMDIFIPDTLLNAIAEWEGLKDVRLTGKGSQFDRTDTVFIINGDQVMLNGNTELAKYMENVFNNTIWKLELKAVMERFKEYFPRRDTQIRVDAYAQIRMGNK